jgi:hypothetical protein
MTPDTRTNDELLNAARTGDEGALAVLVVFQGMPSGIEGIWG